MTAGLNNPLEAAVDDCWNRIGIRGDRSCEKLTEHIHCRNCPVHAEAAVLMLDRYSAGTDTGFEERAAPEGDTGPRQPTLIFRIGDEWLGLATTFLLEVSPVAPIHTLPHQRSRSLMGLTNVRGTLAACLSLPELLGIAGAGGSPAATGRRVVPLMLILSAPGGPLVTPVEEVAGIDAIPLATIVEPAGGAEVGAPSFTRGVLQWQGRSVTLLDGDTLMAAMTRSLA
ncbi:chemotaxis protein CheW [Radicibacter daui]|uniref:chemotaxis protein CheW n=1 Tax=Radicibacter daui TaxID=3064829 RepID=UPI004046B6DA